MNESDLKVYVEKQWDEWVKNNPVDSMNSLEMEELKSKTIEDLSFVSKMDVKEYTLYQKWCEIHQKYPVKEVSTLFGVEKQLIDDTQDSLISEIKKNIWTPKTPEDYLNLKPVLQFTDDSVERNDKGIDGSIIKSKTKRTNLPELWNTARTFISTMKNNSNIGRNLNFFAMDEVTGKYLGVICISSDFLDLTPRDNFIGWNRTEKTQGGMINYTAIGSTIVPFQPLGYNYVGGKLLALLCLSDEVQRIWKQKYGDVLVGVTTTSLYGKTKSGGLSQYDNLDHWKKMGFSSGSVSFEPERETRYEIRNWLMKNHTRKYFEWYVAKRHTGQPYKRDHKNRSLYFTYSKLGIPKELVRSEHHRGIYFSPLYDNTNDFLCGKIKEKDLVKSFDTSYESLTDIWKNKHAKGRIKQLMKKDQVSYETLFYDDLIYLTWEETKQKYLCQVGR